MFVKRPNVPGNNVSILMLGFHAMQDEQNCSRDRITPKNINFNHAVCCMPKLSSKAKEIFDKSSLFSTSIAYRKS